MNNLLSYIDTSKKQKPKREAEKDVEKYFKRRVRELFDGESYKFTSPSRRSVPDQLVVIPFELLPTGFIFFTECKASDGEVTPQQADEHERLRKKGCLVYVVYCRDDVEKVLWEVGEVLRKLRIALCV